MNDRLVALAHARPRLLLLALVGVLLLIASPDQSLMAYDEGIYAIQARDMVESGDWVTQAWWDGGLMFDRAMGLQWLVAASQSLFGFGEFASRLPVMLAGLASAFLIYAIGLRMVSPGAALLGAAILVVTPVWIHAARLTTQDVPLVTMELLGIWALLRAEDARRKWAWGALAGLAFGAGFALKSFMVFPAAAALLPYLIADHRRHRHLANPGLYAGMLIGLAPSAIWLAQAAALHGDVVVSSFFGKLLYLAEEDFHAAGPTYYLWAMPLNGFPWPFLAIPGAVIAWRSTTVRRKSLLIGFPLALFLLLSAFTTRTWYYALQLYPMLALLAAVFVLTLAHRYGAGGSRAVTWFTWVQAGLGALLVVAALVLFIRPGLLNDPKAALYATVGLGTGLGFLVPLAVSRFDPARRAPALWAAGWLAGPALAIAAMFATGLWGNYNPAIKTALTSPPVAQALGEAEVWAVVPETQTLTQQKELLLFRGYIPGPLRHAKEAATIPEGALFWIPTPRAGEVGGADRAIGQAGGWTLLRKDGQGS